MNLINVPSDKWTNSFNLHSHYAVGPTACEPLVDAAYVRPVAVSGLPLPLSEDFGNAFKGKCFVRIPKRSPAELHVSGPVARLRSHQPAFGSQSCVPLHAAATPLFISSDVRPSARFSHSPFFSPAPLL